MAFPPAAPPPQPDDAQKPEPEQADAAASPNPEDLNSKVEKDLYKQMKAAKDRRKKYASEWKSNIQKRMGQMDAARAGGMMVNGNYVGTIEDDSSLKSTINPDWALTKMKTANLFSQVPTVLGTHENDQFAAAVPAFMKALNYELSEKRTNMAVPMEEVLSDVVNASGIAGIYVDYQARFTMKQMPKVDPKTVPPGTPPQALPMVEVPAVADYRFGAARISPRYLLWPAEFLGSCFDDGDWIGYDGGLSWADAQNAWLDDEGKPILQDTEKDELTSDSENGGDDEDLRVAPTRDDRLSVAKVRFSHLFYWRHRVDPDEKCFSCIWEIVFVKGREKPVLHRPWKGQKLDPQTGKYLGAQKFPVRILTLTYVTDNPVPPSDTSAGAPQVNDLRLSRTQLMQNRARSVPIRYYDTNRVDPMIADNLMRGNVQGFIPLQGRGDGAIGEVARASYPKEDLEFDAVTKSDLMEVWQFGGVSQGQQQHRQTKQESQTYASQFQTRIGQERNRVAQFFLSVCEVLAGLMCLYSDFPSLSDQERQKMMQTWDNKRILHDLVLKIRPDSQVVLDAGARVERLFKVLNMVGKSGFVNPKPIIAKIVEYGDPDLDLDEVLLQESPQKPPDEPTIAFRFSGKEDIQNPAVMALLLQLGKAPSPEMLEEAKRLLLLMQMPPEPPKPEPQVPGQPPPQPPKKVHPAPDVAFEQKPEAIPGVNGAPSAHPDWSTASKVAKRSQDMSS